MNNSHLSTSSSRCCSSYRQARSRGRSNHSATDTSTKFISHLGSGNFGIGHSRCVRRGANRLSLVGLRTSSRRCSPVSFLVLVFVFAPEIEAQDRLASASFLHRTSCIRARIRRRRHAPGSASLRLITRQRRCFACTSIGTSSTSTTSRKEWNTRRRSAWTDQN